MKHLTILIIFCLVSHLLSAQNVQRSSLGISGNSIEVTVGQSVYYVSQSIGQNSIIGTFNNNETTIRQGFQQPPIKVKIIANLNNSLNVVVFPNPVNTYVTVSFNEQLKAPINITIYDVSGKIILNKSQKPTKSFNVDMSLFSSGVYLLNINSENKNFTTRLIKK